MFNLSTRLRLVHGPREGISISELIRSYSCKKHYQNGQTAFLIIWASLDDQVIQEPQTRGG